MKNFRNIINKKNKNITVSNIVDLIEFGFKNKISDTEFNRNALENILKNPGNKNFKNNLINMIMNKFGTDKDVFIKTLNLHLPENKKIPYISENAAGPEIYDSVIDICWRPNVFIKNLSDKEIKKYNDFYDSFCILKPKYKKPLKLFLKIPSGKIVIANDLRDIFDIKKNEDDFNVNQIYGKFKCSKFWAKKGMFHCFVGNSCPNVYKNLNNKELIIGDVDQKELNQINKRNVPKKLKNFPIANYRKISNITTGLWWYSIMDYGLYCKLIKENPTRVDIEIFDIEPGIYKCLHYHHLKKDEYMLEKNCECIQCRNDKYPESIYLELFSHIKKIGDC